MALLFISFARKLFVVLELLNVQIFEIQMFIVDKMTVLLLVKRVIYYKIRIILEIL